MHELLPLSGEKAFVFRTINQKGLPFDEVFQKIIWFMKQDPIGKYGLMLGTDSQVHGNETVFEQPYHPLTAVHKAFYDIKNQYLSAYHGLFGCCTY